MNALFGALLLSLEWALGAPVVLIADGKTAPYAQITRVLVSEPETPDCGHSAFGPHITPELDPYLGPVFNFHLHVKPDNDRCVGTDRQRVEIKTMGDRHTPNDLKGFLNDKMTHRWRFKLPPGFKSSQSFTHLHQIKSFDGDADLPLVTLTARKGNPDHLEVIHIDSSKQTHILSTDTVLQPLLGIWLEAYEKITYGPEGSYSLVIHRVTDGAQVLSLSKAKLDLWRKGATVVRPKWGIYRSLAHPEELRDEDVRYGGFCIAKGSDDCAPGIFPKIIRR